MPPNIAELRKLVLPKADKPLHSTVSSGCAGIDALLPDRGFSRGSLTEWFSSRPGSGTTILAMQAAYQSCEQGGTVVVVDWNQCFYPPAVAACQLDVSNIVVVQVTQEADELWAVDQALRCQDVAAVVAWPRRIDDRMFRRWQLAAEHSGVMGLFVRPVAALPERSWAQTRLLVTPQRARSGWHLSVELLRCSRSSERRVAQLEIHDLTGEIREAHPRHLAAQLAHPTRPARKARA